MFLHIHVFENMFTVKDFLRARESLSSLIFIIYVHISYRYLIYKNNIYQAKLIFMTRLSMRHINKGYSSTIRKYFVPILKKDARTNQHKWWHSRYHKILNFGWSMTNGCRRDTNTQVAALWDIERGEKRSWCKRKREWMRDLWWCGEKEDGETRERGGDGVGGRGETSGCCGV